jgi:hypothetical protein
MTCKHENFNIEDVEAQGNPTSLKVKVACEECGAAGWVDVWTQDLPVEKIQWDEPPCFPRPESCDGCHCKTAMEYIEEPDDPAVGSWVCGACGQIHCPPGEGGPPYDAATATGMYDPEGHL